MLVGNRSTFGIEFELDAEAQVDERESDWYFGTVCFWCGGERVGRPTGDVALCELVAHAEHVRKDDGRRCDEELWHWCASDVSRFLRGALYEDRGQSNEEISTAAKRYFPMVVSPGMPVFDDWHFFLVDGERESRLIWARCGADGANECRLAIGEYQAVLGAFVSRLMEQALSVRQVLRERPI
jgi:hypothetical protein